MKDSKNLPHENQLPPEILSLKTLYRMNIIYVMFILNGNRTATSKALDMSVRSLRDNLKEIEKTLDIKFPDGHVNYRLNYLKMNHKDEINAEQFLANQGPKNYITKLKLYVSEYGFPCSEKEIKLSSARKLTTEEIKNQVDDFLKPLEKNGFSTEVFNQ